MYGFIVITVASVYTCVHMHDKFMNNVNKIGFRNNWNWIAFINIYTVCDYIWCVWSGMCHKLSVFTHWLVTIWRWTWNIVSSVQSDEQLTLSSSCCVYLCTSWQVLNKLVRWNIISSQTYSLTCMASLLLVASLFLVCTSWQVYE